MLQSLRLVEFPLVTFKKNHLQNGAKFEQEKTNDQRIIPPLDASTCALVPNASNLHSNTVWKTRFSKLLSSLLWIVTVWAEKKKKYAKNRKWWDKLNVAFLHWRCCLQKFSKEGAIYDWCTCVKLCSWLEVYAEGPLSLLCCKLQPAMYKRMAALVSYDFSNSFLIDVIHAPRIYPIPDVSLV